MRRLGLNRGRRQAPAPAARPIVPVVIPRPSIPDDHLRLIGCPHPLRQERIDMTLRVGGSLLDIARNASMGANAPATLLRHGYAWVDGQPVPYERWGEVIPAAGQTVAFKMVPFDGGGGGSNPLRTVLMIGVLLVANMTGQYWANATYLGGGFSTASASFLSSIGFSAPLGIGSMLVSGAVMVGGMMAVNMLVPAAAPKIPGLGTSEQDEQVYSISGTANKFEPWGDIPMALGFVRWAPNHGAKPYTEIAGNDQYLIELLDWGLGPLVISDLQFGETSVDAFSDVEIQTAAGFPATDDEQSLYTADIFEESLSVLLEYDTPEVRTTGAEADRFSVDISFPALVDYSGTKKKSVTVNVAVAYRLNGAAGDWTATEGFSVTASSSQAVRRTLSVTVPDRGQYDVQLTRTSEESTADGVSDDVYWSVMRTITNASPIDVEFTNATSHLRVKATGEAAGSLDKLNGYTQTWCKIWDSVSETWIEGVSNNPAALYRHVLQCEFNPFPRTDDQLDLDQLADWFESCVAQGFTYNRVVYGPSIPELLAEIAAAGRATEVKRDGRWGVVPERERESVAFDFTPVMVRSVTVKRDLRRAPEAYRCRFLNENTWEEDEMVVFASGYTAETAIIYEVWERKGITKPEHVFASAKYDLAVLHQRRETFLWDVDWANLICDRADLVTLGHPVVGTGLSQGRIKTATDWGDGAWTIEVSEPCIMEAGKTYAVLIRSIEDGTRGTCVVTTVPGASTTLLIPYGPAFSPDKGDLFAFGEQGLETKPLLVTDIKPSADLEAQMVGVDYAPAVYPAAEEEMPPWNPNVTRSPFVGQNTPSAPVINSVVSDESVLVRDADGTLAVRIQISYTLASSPILVDEIRTQYKLSGGAEWVSAPTVAAGDPAFIYDVIELEAYDIRVRAANASTGQASPWVVWSEPHTVIGKTSDPSNVQNYSVQQNGSLSTHRWDQIPDEDRDGYSIRYLPASRYFVWEDAKPLTSATRGTLVTNAALPPGSWICGIKGLDTGGRESATATTFQIEMENDNVIVDGTEQAPAWPGTLTGCIVHRVSGLLVPLSTAALGDYSTWDALLATAWPDPVDEYVYEAPELDLVTDDAARIWADISATLQPGGAGVTDVELQIDYRTAGGAYDGWESWTVGQVTARYVKARARVVSASGVAQIQSFRPVADAPLRSHTVTGLTVAAGGSAFTFGTPFRDVPVVQAFLQGGGNLVAAPSSVTTTGFVFDVYNPSTGVSVGIADVAGYEVKGV